LTMTKHSISRKSEILAEVAKVEEGKALLRSLGTFKFQVENSPDFKRICESLMRFGLSKNEARVFIYLAKYGEQKAHRVSRALSLHRTETYKILKRLEEKSLAYRILDKPIKFAVIPVGKALDNLVQEERQRILQLEEEKKKILEIWESILVPIKDPEALGEFIQVLKGKNQIYIKASEVMKNAENEILIVASNENLLQLFYSGVLDNLAEKAKKIRVEVITDSSLRSTYIIKKLRLKENSLCIDSDDLPSFILSEKSLLLFFDNRNGKNGRRALWTNQKDMIDALRVSFLNLHKWKRLVKTAS